MNLGAFADGALKGYMGAEELKLKQQRQANDDARAKGEQEDRDVKAKSRERQAKAQADITALGRELLPEQYGAGDAQPAAAEQPAGQPAPQGQPAMAGAAPQVGAVGQAPAGNLSQAPALAAPAKPQRDLLSRQMEFTTKAMRIALENSDSLDPTMLAKAHEYTSKMLATEEGQKIYKALGGDSEAINGLAQSLGLDVASAKVVQDPSKGVFQITDSKGKAVDLRQHALYKNAYDVVEALGKRKDEAQGDQKFDFALKKGEAEIGNLKASASANNAQAGYYGANAGLVKAETENVKAGLGKGGTAGAEAKQRYISYAEKVAPRSQDDPKSPDIVALRAIVAAASHPKLAGEKNTELAVNKAARLYESAAAKVDQIIKAKPEHGDKRAALIERAMTIDLDSK